MLRSGILGLTLVAACALAQDDMRGKLTGSWQADNPAGGEVTAYVLQPIDDGMHISGTNAGKTVVEFDCKMARECQIKDAGHKATLMMYFNGDKLVANETIGSRVVRKRFSVTGDGNTMQVEVI